MVSVVVVAKKQSQHALALSPSFVRQVFSHLPTSVARWSWLTRDLQELNSCMFLSISLFTIMPRVRSSEILR